MSLMQEIGQRFSQQFAHQLTGSLKLLEWDQVFGLLQRMDLPPELSVSEQDLNDVTAFSSSARSFESCGYGLWKVVLNGLSDPLPYTHLTLSTKLYVYYTRLTLPTTKKG